jgi:hypothetical protein
MAREIRSACPCTLAATAAGGSLGLVRLLALEADPVALLLVVGAERGGHQGHAAAWADRRTVVVIHPMSIPGSGESDAVLSGVRALGSGQCSGMTPERILGLSPPG